MLQLGAPTGPEIAARRAAWEVLKGYARDLVEGLITDEEVDDLPGFSAQVGGAETVRAIATLERDIRRRHSGPYRAAQRRATGLLRQFLTPAQRAQLTSRGTVTVTGSAGGTYRLYPGIGRTERVVRHGRNYYGTTSICYHETGDALPPADRCVAHLLEILADEPAFVASVNEHPMHRTLWDGAHLRRLYAVRRDPVARAAQIEAIAAAMARVQAWNDAIAETNRAQAATPADVAA